jgi:short-subunit dehydrogenase
MNLNGKTVLLTGAAHGLGRALAVGLAAKGCTLLLVDHDPAGLQATRQVLNSPTAQALTCDLSAPDQRAALIAQVRAQTPRLEVIIHCAGIGSHSRLDQMTSDEVQQVLQVNTLAPLELTAGLLPLLPPGEPAGIVAIGSLAGVVTTPGMSLYSASKAALHAFSQAADAELAHRQHFSLLVILGAMRGTNFGQSIRHPAGGQPGWYRKLDVDAEQAAAKIIRAIERQRTRLVIPGWYGGVLALSTLFAPLTQAIARRAYQKLRLTSSSNP